MTRSGQPEDGRDRAGFLPGGHARPDTACAYRVSEAVVSWRETYPDLMAEWDALGRRPWP